MAVALRTVPAMVAAATWAWRSREGGFRRELLLAQRTSRVT